MRLLVTTIVSTALMVVVAGAAAAPAKENYQLKGEVYPNSLYKIEMENKAGKDLRTVKAGTYRIKIEDKASDPQLPPPRVPASTGRRPWPEGGDDLDRQAPQGDVQVPLRPACSIDAGLVPRYLRRR